MLSFLLPMSFTEELQKEFGWDTVMTDWLAYLSSGFRVYPYLKLDKTLLTVVFVLSLFAVSVIVVNAIFVWYLFSQNSFRMLWTVILLRLTASAMFGPLYIPCLSLLATQLVCKDQSNEGFPCWGVAHSMLVTLAVLFGIMLILIALVFQATYYNRDPTSASYLARPHSRVQAFQLFVKTLFSVCFTIFADNPSYYWFLVALCMLGNGSVALCYTYYCPYFHWQFNEVKVVYSWVLTWTSFCVCLNMAWSSPDDTNVTIMFFVMIPVVSAASLVTLRVRKNFLLHCKPKEISNVYEVELKCRFMLEEVTSYMRKKKEDFGVYAYHDEKKPPHPCGYVYTPLPSFPKSEDEHDIIRLRHENALDEVEVIYQHGLRRFPVAMMSLLKAQHGFCYNVDVAVSQQALDEAEDRFPWFDESFSIYSLRLAHEQTSESNQHDIISFISSQKYQEDALREDEHATKFQLAFWTELLNPTPDLAVLHDVSTKINDAMNNAQDAYKKLIKLNPMSSHLLRLYASFIIELQNQPDKAVIMLKRADDLEEAQLRANRDGANLNSALDDRSAVISVSGSRERMGEIIDINTSIMRLFGFSRSELMGANVSRLMPSPYNYNHSSFMNHTIPTNAGYLNRSNIVFGIHKNGFLLPLEIFLKEVSGVMVSNSRRTDHSVAGGKNSVFLAVVRCAPVTINPIKLGPIISSESGMESAKAIVDDDTRSVNYSNLAYHSAELRVEFCFVDSQHFVTFATAGCLALFDVSPEELRSGSVLITSWVQEFEQCRAKLMSPKGDTFSLCLRGTIVRAHGIAQIIDVGADAYMLLQINISSKLLATAKHSAYKGTDNSSFRLKNDTGSLRSKFQDSSSVRSLNRNSVVLDTVSQSGKSVNDGASLSGSIGRKKRLSIFKTQALQSKANSKSKNYDILLSSAHTSETSLHAQLRFFSKSSENNDLTYGLKILRAALLCTLILVCGIAVAKFTALNFLMNKYNNFIDHVSKAAQLRYYLVRIAYNAYLITQSAAVISTSNAPGFYSSSQAYSSLSLILSDANEMESLSSSLFLDNIDDLSSDNLHFYSQQVIPLYSMVQSYGVTSFSSVNYRIWDALKLFSASARGLSALQLSQIQDTEPTTFFVLRNGFGDLLSYMNTSCGYFEMSARNSVAIFTVWALCLSLCSIFIVLCVIFLAVKPTIWMIEDNKLSVLMLFTEIPLPIIALFKNRCKERLEKFTNNADDTVAIDKVEKDENIVNEFNFEKYKSEGREVLGVNDSASRYFALMRISVALGACIIYFISTYWAEYGANLMTMISAPSNLNWAYYRDASLVLINYKTIHYLLQNYTISLLNGSHGIVQTGQGEIQNEISLYFQVSSALADGSSSDSWNLIAPTGILLAYIRDNDCLPSYGMPLGCDFFLGSVFHQGLMGTITAVVVEMSTSLNSINADIIGNGKLLNFNALNATVASSSFVAVKQFAEVYMPILSTLINSAYLNLVSSGFDSLYVARIVGLCVFIVFILALYVFYYNPLIWKLNSEQKRTTLLLLIIPANIMEKMPSLRNFVEKHRQDWDD